MRWQRSVPTKRIGGARREDGARSESLLRLRARDERDDTEAPAAGACERVDVVHALEQGGPTDARVVPGGVHHRGPALAAPGVRCARGTGVVLPRPIERAPLTCSAKHSVPPRISVHFGLVKPTQTLEVDTHPARPELFRMALTRVVIGGEQARTDLRARFRR